MKLVKWVPTLAGVFILAACSNTAEKVSATETTAQTVPIAENQARKPLNGTRTLDYHCANKVKVSATYTFVEGRPKKVDLKTGKKEIKDVSFESDSLQAMSFKSNKYSWGLNETGGTLTEHGKGGDKILAKQCETQVNKK